MVELAREQLLSRAERLGWTWDTNPDPRLFIDGEEQQPTIVGDEVQFEFPASAQTVRLMSKTFVPADRSGGVGDPRAADPRHDLRRCPLRRERPDGAALCDLYREGRQTCR